MKKYWKWILLALIVIALSIASVVLPVKDWIRSFITWVQQLGPIGVVVFIAAYALATVLFLPGWIFTVGAGLVYGIIGGTLVALTGAVIGATLAFIVARYFLRKNIEEYTKRNPRFKAIDDAIGKNGWKIIGLLRLSPLIPFNLSNYFYGITSVSLKAYVAVSAIGMIPGTLLYAYLGAIGKAGISGEKTQHSVAQYVLLGVGLVATIAVTILVSRIARERAEEIRRGLVIANFACLENLRFCHQRRIVQPRVVNFAPHFFIHRAHGDGFPFAIALHCALEDAGIETRAHDRIVVRVRDLIRMHEIMNASADSVRAPCQQSAREFEWHLTVHRQPNSMNH